MRIRLKFLGLILPLLLLATPLYAASPKLSGPFINAGSTLTSGGKNWLQKTKGIKVYAHEIDKTKGCYSEYPVMRMDPKNPKRLVLEVSSGGGGKTWEKYGKLPIELKDSNDGRIRVSNILWDAKEKNTLYMSGSHGNIWKSSELGLNWVNLLNIDRNRCQSK